jgi:hypothetical protein
MHLTGTRRSHTILASALFSVRLRLNARINLATSAT